MESFLWTEKECLIPFWKQTQKNSPNSRVCWSYTPFQSLKGEVYASGLCFLLLHQHHHPMAIGLPLWLVKLLKIRLKDHYLPKWIRIVCLIWCFSYIWSWKLNFLKFYFLVSWLFSDCFSLTALSAPSLPLKWLFPQRDLLCSFL